MTGGRNYEGVGWLGEIASLVVEYISGNCLAAMPLWKTWVVFQGLARHRLLIHGLIDGKMTGERNYEGVGWLGDIAILVVESLSWNCLAAMPLWKAWIVV